MNDENVKKAEVPCFPPVKYPDNFLRIDGPEAKRGLCWEKQRKMGPMGPDRKEELQDRLLERYGAEDPVWVTRIEALTADGDEESLLPTDEEGDSLLVGSTHELMSAQPAVRVLIREGVSQRDAVRLLRKSVKWTGDGLDIEDGLSV